MIYTIGTSNRSVGEFLRELQVRSITQLIDVRSNPYSRSAEFNRECVQRWAGTAGIMYRWEGRVLGGRSDYQPSDPEYQTALDRLVNASRRESVAIFCAEGEPTECHRSYQIGACLFAIRAHAVRNIRRDGSDEPIEETLRRTPPDRFGEQVRSILGIGSISDPDAQLRLF